MIVELVFVVSVKMGVWRFGHVAINCCFSDHVSAKYGGFLGGDLLREMDLIYSPSVWGLALRKLFSAVLIVVTFFPSVLSGQTLDEQRQVSVAEVISALELYAADTGTYQVDGAGANGNGQGWFHRESGNYPASIYSALVGYLTTVPADPLHTDISRFSRDDFLIYRCGDRVGVFSNSNGVQPSATDQSWWNENSCNTRPIDRLNHPYFQLSRPVADVTIPVDVDSDRVIQVAQVIGGLESFAASTGTFIVSGGGANGRGQGWFHRDTGNYPASIYSVIDEHLSTIPSDPLHTDISQFSRDDFLVYRCADRIGVFSKSDGVQPSTEDQLWWSDNSCNTRPINSLDHPYFQVSQALGDVLPEPPVVMNIPPLAADDAPAQEVAVGGSLTISVLSNDTDSDGFLDVSTLVTSVAWAVPQTDGTILYAPPVDTSTSVPATFTYTIKDNDGAESNVATVTVNVTEAPNIAPVAMDDVAPNSVAIGDSITINVLANDVDSCLLYTSPSPRDQRGSRMPSSA